MTESLSDSVSFPAFLANGLQGRQWPRQTQHMNTEEPADSGKLLCVGMATGGGDRHFLEQTLCPWRREGEDKALTLPSDSSHPPRHQDCGPECPWPRPLTGDSTIHVVQLDLQNQRKPTQSAAEPRMRTECGQRKKAKDAVPSGLRQGWLQRSSRKHQFQNARPKTVTRPFRCLLLLSRHGAAGSEQY